MLKCPLVKHWPQSPAGYWLLCNNTETTLKYGEAAFMLEQSTRGSESSWKLKTFSLTFKLERFIDIIDLYITFLCKMFLDLILFYTISILLYLFYYLMFFYYFILSYLFCLFDIFHPVYISFYFTQSTLILSYYQFVSHLWQFKLHQLVKKVLHK